MRRPIRLPVISLLVAGVAGCAAGEATIPAWTPPPDPAIDEVETVLFLVGDAGDALPGRSPVLSRLSDEVDLWAGRLGRDSAVAVAYLGDNVYPVGVRPRTDPDFPRDSLRLLAQVEVVEGPEARAYHTPGIFLAGNHDWGSEVGPEGVERLRNQELLLRGLAAERGTPLSLAPEAGHPGPHPIDLGPAVRLIAVDTHWWLQPREDEREDSVVTAIGRAIQEADARKVVFVAHHPYLSGGPHGAPMPLWEGLGFLYLLRQTGALIQDVNSVAYRDLRVSLRAIFAATRPPLVWAGGHDHSLQVIRGRFRGDPRWSLVSGSGSKGSDVFRAPGMVMGANRPGYMRLTFLRDGSVLLHVYGGAAETHVCDGDEAAVEACMATATRAIELIWAGRLE